MVTPLRQSGGMTDVDAPWPNEPLQPAPSLAMSAAITENDRRDLIEMLHELSVRRRVDPWPND